MLSYAAIRNPSRSSKRRTEISEAMWGERRYWMQTSLAQHKRMKTTMN